MLYDSYDVEVLADRLEMEEEVIKEMNELTNFEFTFKTDAEYRSERCSGYIEKYKNVRMEIITSEGWHIDFPFHSEEEYFEYLSKYTKDGDRIIKVYANIDCYEANDWY
jgi:hypothetical protein